MGLAASQCRLLFITSRQNDVSAKMQRISNDRLTLSRDEDDLYTKYNRMLNATKYQNADGTDISYNAIMGITAGQNGLCNVIQNSTGAVVLNQALANKFGLTAESGDANTFKQKFGNNINNFITQAEGANAADIIAKLSEVPETPEAPETPTFEKEDWMNGFLTEFGEYPTEHKVSRDTLLSQLGEKEVTFSGLETTKQDFQDGGAAGNTTITLSSLLSGTDKVYSLADDDSARGVPTAAAINNLYRYARPIMDAISDVLGMDENGKTALKNECDKYIQQFESLIRNNHDQNKASYYNSNGNGAGYIARSQALGGFLANGTATSGTDRDFYLVNMTELTHRLLEVAIQYLSGKNYASVKSSWDGQVDRSNTDTIINLAYNSKGYCISRWENKFTEAFGNAITEYTSSSNALYVITDGKAGKAPSAQSTQTTIVPSGTDQANENLAKYYKNLWNNLSSYGWTTQSNEDIQTALNNGVYFVNGTAISESDRFDQVSDQDAKDKAKTWYDNETRKIKRKEDKMDMENTKLQTEYSALTKDYDSVKSIIDANVQKSFTYCQNG